MCLFCQNMNIREHSWTFGLSFVFNKCVTRLCASKSMICVLVLVSSKHPSVYIQKARQHYRYNSVCDGKKQLQDKYVIHRVEPLA